MYNVFRIKSRWSLYDKKINSELIFGFVFCIILTAMVLHVTRFDIPVSFLNSEKALKLRIIKLETRLKYINKSTDIYVTYQEELAVAKEKLKMLTTGESIKNEDCQQNT